MTGNVARLTLNLMCQDEREPFKLALEYLQRVVFVHVDFVRNGPREVTPRDDQIAEQANQEAY